MKYIHIRDLKVGDFLLNLGQVNSIEEYSNGYRVWIESHFTTFVYIDYKKSLSVHILDKIR